MGSTVPAAAISRRRATYPSSSSATSQYMYECVCGSAAALPGAAATPALAASPLAATVPAAAAAGAAGAAAPFAAAVAAATFCAAFTACATCPACVAAGATAAAAPLAGFAAAMRAWTKSVMNLAAASRAPLRPASQASWCSAGARTSLLKRAHPVILALASALRPHAVKQPSSSPSFAPAWQARQTLGRGSAVSNRLQIAPSTRAMPAHNLSHSPASIFAADEGSCARRNNRT